MEQEVTLKAGERIDQLSSQGVQIIQSSEVFAFSLDAVLLAAFVRPSQKRRALLVDLCAGNGAVGLFLNRRFAGRWWKSNSNNGWLTWRTARFN